MDVILKLMIILNKHNVLDMRNNMEFYLSDKQEILLRDWLRIQYDRVIEEQKHTIKPDNISYLIAKESWDLGYPYEGAIGGGLTYSFTPTSIGDICIVSYAGNEIDITEYDNW
jgi:hypothetical protein